MIKSKAIYCLIIQCVFEDTRIEDTRTANPWFLAILQLLNFVFAWMTV